MDPITLALLGLPQIFKVAQAGIQSEQANKLKVQDTTTPAEREALGLARQGANAQLPGYGAALNQVEAGTNGTLAAATRAGSSASSVLGLLSAADASHQQALAGLQTRSNVFHQQAQRGLEGELVRKAQHERQDQETFDRNKAALREASQRNLYGAVDGVSQIGAYAYGLDRANDTHPDGLKNPLIKTAGNKLAAATGPEVSGPDDVLAPHRKKVNYYGFPDYGTSSWLNQA